MDIFKLYRHFWNYAFSNPERIKPNDIAIYSFAIEHCNRLGWKEKFGFPTTMAMEAVGIKSYSVYKRHFDNLVELDFFNVVEYSKNQYSSNIIALKENDKAPDKAHDKALDKAMIKHTPKQSESTVQSIDSIIIQINNKQYTNIQLNKLNKVLELYLSDDNKISQDDIDEIYNAYPTKCPVKNSSTGKSKKTNQEKIKSLLIKDYTKDELKSIILRYVDLCVKDKVYMKNFGTFLNNIPDYSDDELSGDAIEAPSEEELEKQRIFKGFEIV